MKIGFVLLFHASSSVVEYRTKRRLDKSIIHDMIFLTYPACMHAGHFFYNATISNFFGRRLYLFFLKVLL